MVSIVVLAIALAMDAFAVSIGTGVCLKTVTSRQTFRLAWHFGLFQAMMPIIGWGLGLTVRDVIARFDHWVAFLLLAFIGLRMVRDAFNENEDKPKTDPTKGASLVILSVATSIDALAVGLSMAVLEVSIWFPALIIGVVAGLFTVVGLHIGRAVGSAGRLSRYAEVLGGLTLLAIGVNILREHGVFDAFI